MSQEKEMQQISENVAISACNSVAVFKQGVSISLDAFASNKLSNNSATPTKVKLKEPDNKTSAKQKDIAPWGSNNLYPQERISMIRKDTEIAPILKKKAAFMGGLGVLPAKFGGFNQTADGSIIPIIVPAITEAPEAFQFTNDRKFKRWWREASVDYCYFGNIFPEIILEPKRNKVIRIAHQEATKARLVVMGDNDNAIKWCILNSDWQNYKDENSKQLPVIDSVRTEDVKELKEAKGKPHYIYISSYPAPGDDYYQTPAHEGYFLSGWYDIGIAIPAFKKYLMKNQMSIKYHIEIDTKYWPAKFPDWEKVSKEKQQEYVRSEMQAFEKEMTGIENSGVAFTTAMEYMIQSQSHRSYWKFTKLDNKSTDGEGIVDLREASMHKYRAFGFDPAVLGLGPGRENAGGGSGSDKWAAVKMMQAELLPDRAVLLDPVNFIYEYNGWSDGGIFPWVFDHPMFATNTASELPSNNPNPARNDA